MTITLYQESRAIKVIPVSETWTSSSSSHPKFYSGCSYGKGGNQVDLIKSALVHGISNIVPSDKAEQNVIFPFAFQRATWQAVAVHPRACPAGILAGESLQTHLCSILDKKREKSTLLVHLCGEEISALIRKASRMRDGDIIRSDLGSTTLFACVH